ncbi:MAG: TolC family protein [Bacteroidota bacterium]
MQKNKIQGLLLCLLFGHLLASSQSSELTFDQALAAMLKNNYSISIAKNLETETKNSNTLGNAGMLPTVAINATGTFANNAIKQEYSTGTTLDKSGIVSKNISTGAYLTWIIFDGMKMFATKEQLDVLESMGALNTKIQIENSIVQLINNYYNIVMIKQMINGLKSSMAVSEERLKIAQKKFDIGTASKVDLLQAKVDLNAQKTTLIREKALLNDAKAALNQMLILPIDKEFDVQDSIPLLNDYKYEDLKNAILSKNSDLLLAQRSIDSYKCIERATKGNYYPKLNLNANYIFNRAQNQAGLTLLNQNLGLNLGFTASWTIFNGFNNANLIKNQKLDIENSMLNFDNTKSLIQLNLIKAFKKYNDDMDALNLQTENIKLAKENLDIALELFRVGTTNSIQLQTSQQSYLDATNQLANARYNAKLSETQLLKLSGGISK